MKMLVAIFFSSKYWNKEAERQQVTADISRRFEEDRVIAIVDGRLPEMENYGEYDALLAIPASGSVQPDIISFSEAFTKVILFAAYVPGNFELELTDKMLCKNAAPTLMDTYGVLKRREDKVITLQKKWQELSQYRKVLDAYNSVQQGKITVIQGPEPWVISVSKDYELYEKQLGIQVDVATQDELINLYEDTTFEEALEIYWYFRGDAKEIVEPTEEDLVNCSRMAKAMLKLIENHECSGIAIACFNLICRTGVNPCLGVSYINSVTDYFAACEGDIDSAITMLLMRKLTKEKPWMANPCLQEDDTVNFAHCTAPLQVAGKKQSFLLRNHHETGVGASPRVFYDTGLKISLLRYSGVLNEMTIHSGESINGRYEPNCRTQMRIAIENYDHYLSTVLGCHQVITFEDITGDMRELCRLLQVKVQG